MLAGASTGLIWKSTGKINVAQKIGAERKAKHVYCNPAGVRPMVIASAGMTGKADLALSAHRMLLPFAKTLSFAITNSWCCSLDNRQAKTRVISVDAVKLYSPVRIASFRES